MSRHTKTSLPLMMLLIFISVQLLFSCVHALPAMEEYDFVDNNTSDVDASADNGVHSDFIGQQYGPDGVYDIVAEADTESNVTLDLYIDIFDDSRTGWTRHGTDPYLHIQNYPTDYVWLGLDRTSSVGDFGFQNSSKSSETINSAVLRVYAWKEDTQDNFWVYLWDNSSWGNAYNVTRTSAGWTDFDVTARLNTWVKIDSAKIYLNGDTTQAKDYRLFADCVMLRIGYAMVNHDLDLEVQWRNATCDMPFEELCIFGGTMAPENLEVDVWNGTAWQNLFSSLSSGWNNVSVTDYLVSPVFTIRFKGGTETVDALQDSWQIDSSLLHTWTETNVHHDVSIISVIPSATEIDIGQLVNITVIVKNEGNTTETFNVTLYYDNNTIGIQTVIDLVPNANKTLTFIWNTTGVIPDINYTIKAEADVLLEETDIDDNTFTGDSVAVKSHLVSTPFDWGSILPYALPIILGVLSFSVVGIVLKRHGTGSTPLDFDYFDEMVAGGIPNGYSVMIVGGESSGKSVLCQQLVHAYLNKEKPCIYITYDCFPDEIRKNMKNFNLETSSHEQKGIFKFIDCYSSAADVTSEEENFVDFPFSLSDLGIAISEVVDRVTHKSTKIFLDSTAPIFTRLEPSIVVEFLQDRSAKTKGSNGNFFYTVGKGTVPPALMPRLKEIVDCIIELDFEEKKGATSRRMRVRKLRNRRYVNTWIPFKIKPRKGIVFLPFENSAQRYKQKEQSNTNT
jgi:KaiC/GvpD/RAD55 family RecA-like ATPase